MDEVRREQGTGKGGGAGAIQRLVWRVRVLSYVPTRVLSPFRALRLWVFPKEEGGTGHAKSAGSKLSAGGAVCSLHRLRALAKAVDRGAAMWHGIGLMETVPERPKGLRACTPASFISEHTAEYMMVFSFVRAMRGRWPDIRPFYFWASREGNNTSLESDGHPLRVVAAFPRRPKVLHPGGQSALMKVNAEVFKHAARFKDWGIPTLVSMPLVSSITQIRLGAECVWFSVREQTAYFDAEVEFDLEGKRPAGGVPACLSGPLDTEAIWRVGAMARVMPWREVVETLRIVRPRSEALPFIGGYKPVYFGIGPSLVEPAAGLR